MLAARAKEPAPIAGCPDIARRPSCEYPERRPVFGKPLMSHKHEHLIRTIFHDPISGNIHWREIESLLHHLGAATEPLAGARLRVKLNGVEGILHRPHHSNTLDKNGVKALREYLAHARVTPSLYEARTRD